VRGVGTGGDGVEFTAYYFLRNAEGAESFVIWDASIGGVEVEVGGEESSNSPTFSRVHALIFVQIYGTNPQGRVKLTK